MEVCDAFFDRSSAKQCVDASVTSAKEMSEVYSL